METAARILPTCALAAAAWALAWLATGSIDSADWLPYASIAGLLLLVLLLTAVAQRPRRAEVAALGALAALAAWEALSLTWSAVPSLARDEALLTLFYAIALLTPLLTLRGGADRLLATGTVAAEAALLAVATALELRFGGNQSDHFYAGRLSFPISYPNAQAAVFLIGFWPAIVCAAHRRAPLLLRALAMGGATAIAAGWLTAQSKGGALAIAVSAVVLFAVSPLRLRLLPPALVAAGLTAAAYRPLTAPFRSGEESALAADVRHTGATILVLTAIALAVGTLYALADRRLELGRRETRLAGAAVAALTAVAVVAGAAIVLSRVDLGAQWRTFKNAPTNSASSHLLQLGSYRYDIWRVALKEFEHHPLAGIGSRGFGPAYLELRNSPDTPVRAHSFELDALSEVGIVGFALVATALVLLLFPIVSRTRARDPGATAAFGGAAYWLAHASVDWLWTVPACGLPFFLLLGAGNAGGTRALLSRRAAVASAAVVATIVVVLFVPPWLSARLSVRGQIAWAKRLDPLAVDPYVSASARAPTPRAAIPPLQAAVRKEPRVVELRFALAKAYERAGELRAARRELLEAKRLDPLEPRIDEALRALRRG
ncbi:MAG TPA: O-antigen ligase family protein [Gaiellaceae bacterium]|nr:O-antigen ligase family protein [Gaiellaceae bacterium]